MDKARILLADDDPVILFTLADGMRRAGYEVLEARDGHQALALCKEHRPDIALLDIQMPGVNGIAVCEQLKAEADVPVMFLSAHDQPELVERAIREGALGYLVKPLSAAQIAPAVAAALARAADIKQLKQAEQSLSVALRTNRDIATAVGLIMERHELSAEDAFETLRAYARRHRISVHSVALKLVQDPTSLALEPVRLGRG
jgi:response regulator NasT